MDFPYFSQWIFGQVMGLYPGDPGPPGADCSGTVLELGERVRHLRTASGELVDFWSEIRRNMGKTQVEYLSRYMIYL